MVTPVQLIRRKKALRRYLKAHGQGARFRGLNIAPVAGPVYRDGIRWLERREWPKLPPTGRADSRVLAVLFPAKPQSIGAKALKHAKAELGVKEHPSGSNRGPRVDQFAAACGLRAVPWCACFVTWSLRRAGWTQKGWNLAYVPSWVATANQSAHGLRVIGASEVQAGDVVCFDWQKDGIADHIGFVAGPWKNGQGPTLEGNTSAGNNSNGGEVQARTRSLSEVACFIRIT